MSNISLTFNNLSAAVAITLLNAAASAGVQSAGVSTSSPAPSNAPPASAPAPAAGNAPPPASTTSAPAPVQAAPPANTAPQQTPPPGGQFAPTAADVSSKLTDYMKVHGLAGVKAALAECQIKAVPEANPAQLAWLYQKFTAI